MPASTMASGSTPVPGIGGLEPRYDARRALEGATGSAGRTESTSITERVAAVTISFDPDADHVAAKETSCPTFPRDRT
jgi:hypothetical protein